MGSSFQPFASSLSDENHPRTSDEIPESFRNLYDPNRLEEQFAEASTRRDTVFLQQFLADDFLGHGVRGEALTKADVMGRFQLPGYGLSSIRHADIRVRMFGDCAVATEQPVL